MSDELPLVSILCPTYNHESYLSRTLEGFILQKTNFNFEIIVHDDASTDGTVQIIKKYESKCPHLFTNIYQRQNQFSKSIEKVSQIMFAAARGKYIALCEGDDYWIDPLKLQKQIEFLEQNPDYTGCSSNVYEDVNGVQNLVNSGKNIISFDDVACGNGLYTCSLVFRNIIKIPSWMSECRMGDWIISLQLTQRGLIYIFPEPMAVYRLHNTGIWNAKGKEQNLKDIVAAYNIFLREFDAQYKPALKAGAKQYYDQLLNLLAAKPSAEIFNWTGKAFFKYYDLKQTRYLLRYFRKAVFSRRSKPGLSSNQSSIVP